MIGRSTSTRLFTISVAVFAVVVAMNFVCVVFAAVLPVLAAVALVGVIATAGLRWSLFWWRGW